MTDTSELVRLLGHNFVQRKDVKAWQRDNGEWFPDETPMTMADFEAHFDGSKTMGHYMVDMENQCKLFAFDIDIVGCAEAFQGPCDGKYAGCTEQGSHKHGWLVEGEEIWLRDEWLKPDSPYREHLGVQLRCLAEGLALRIDRVHHIPVAICNSGGKGLHVYGFTGSFPAEYCIQLAHEILESFGCFEPTRGVNFFRHSMGQYKAIEIEVFPKQASMDGKRLGNLMALPLGINRKTGRHKDFITCKAGYDTLALMDPIRALEGDLPWE